MDFVYVIYRTDEFGTLELLHWVYSKERAERYIQQQPEYGCWSYEYKEVNYLQHSRT